jgi:flavorubredoxin
VGDNPYVTFGSKGAGAAQALDGVDRICNSLEMVKAFEGILITSKPTEEHLAECRELSEKLAWLERTQKPQRIDEPLL